MTNNITMNAKPKYLTIPNLLTFSSLLLALAGMFFASRDAILAAILPLALCDVFDNLDGHVARKFNMTSVLGAQLDALVDTVAFVVAPFVIALLVRQPLLVLPAMAYVICGVFRLARFNAEPRVGFFPGLPSSHAAHLVYVGIWASGMNPHVMSVAYLGTAVLMVSSFALNQRVAVCVSVFLILLNCSASAIHLWL